MYKNRESGVATAPPPTGTVMVVADPNAPVVVSIGKIWTLFGAEKR